MLTLRRHVIPSILAVLLLSATACTSEKAAGSPPLVTTGPESSTAPRSTSPSAQAPRLEPVGGVDAQTILEEFKGRGMVGHLEALQRIADDNGGNRASGTSGYEASGL